MTAAQVQATVNSDVRHATDSVAHEVSAAQLERVLTQTSAQETSLLLFDTDKAADPTTHLHPLKAVLRQKAAAAARQMEQTHKHTESQQRVQVTTDVQTQAKGHWEQQTATVQGSSVSKWTDGLLGTLGAVTGLALSLIAIFVILKLKKKRE